MPRKRKEEEEEFKIRNSKFKMEDVVDPKF
jgi:hypothetical protein